MIRNAAFILISLLLAFCLSGSSSAGEVLYARYPALSPDGNTIAFTYLGDIWTVPSSGGQARRLTVHEAEDVRPHFSPDGRLIMFSSRRFNNYDVYIVPVEGGQPRRLTFNSATDYGTGWFPGGDSVLFYSTRDGWGDLFKISVAGGMPVKLTGYPYEDESAGRISADARYLIYNIGSGSYRWWRRDLRGGRNTDIYIQDRTQRTFSSSRLTTYPNYDLWPVLSEELDEIYFVSNRDDWAQVWKIPVTGGEPARLTNFEGDGVQWLNSNPRGTMLVFEQGFGIWIMDPIGAEPRKVPIEINSDEKINRTDKKTFEGNVDWFSLSPDEKKIAAVIHGEIFVLPANDPKEGKRITHTSAREAYPVWGADSRTIYYNSDRDGNYDIYSADATTAEETRLTGSPEDEVKPIVSPDGKYLACFRATDRIIRIDLETGEETVWVEGLFSNMPIAPTIDYDWSADSRWLAFAMNGPTYETDIHVLSLDGEMHNVSKFAKENFRPRFSEDGKMVYFTSTINDTYDTYKIDLVPKPTEFFESSFDSLFVEQEESKDDDKEEKPADSVVIDPERIETRRKKAFELASASTYPVLSQDGKKYYFISSIMGKPEVWSINAEGDPDLEQLTHSGQEKSNLVLSADSSGLLYLEGGKIHRCGTSGKDHKTLSFKAVMEIDIVENNRQKFHEAWRMLDTYFYDPTFRGADWGAVREKYEPLVEHVRTDREFRNLIYEMMGELRASHLAIYSREPSPKEEDLTGEIGIDLDYAALENDGLFRIDKVLKDSPADLVGIKPGHYLRSISGVPLSPQRNLNVLLAGTRNNRLKIAVSDDPDGEVLEFDVKPVPYSRRRDLVYADWVERRRQIVDSLSGNRLAYLHIRDMNRRSLDKFQQELVSIAEQKEGVIIDVRNNGGGSIAVHLLGFMARTPYILRTFRDFPATSENKMRSKAVEKSMALLINNYSGSNSEIFAEGFRKLGLGKIIGEPTAGGVIGTGAYTLIDGTKIRRPSWGAFTTEMEDTDLHPRQPDILVENLPDDLINGRDPQLIRAVQELMQELQMKE